MQAAVQIVPSRIIVGASPTYHVGQAGWLSLAQSDLDITDLSNWRRLFRPSSLDAILAEHVFEHLTPEGARKAASLCYHFLARGGYLRVAVPDGFHFDLRYVEWVRPGGSGESFLSAFRTRAEREHQILFNYRTITRLFENAGFDVTLLEWFDEFGRLHKRPWNPEQGDIRLAHNRFWSGVLSIACGAPYTSLILDAVK